MKIHVVVGMGQSTIKTSDVSCYCHLCISGMICDSWSETVKTSITDCGSESISNSSTTTHSESGSDTTLNTKVTSESGSDSNSTPNTKANDETTYCVVDFIAAIYDVNWYIGEVLAFDKDDNDFEVSWTQKELISVAKKPRQILDIQRCNHL